MPVNSFFISFCRFYINWLFLLSMPKVKKNLTNFSFGYCADVDDVWSVTPAYILQLCKPTDSEV